MQSALLFAFLFAAVQGVTWTDPLWHSYTPLPVKFTQALVYTTLKKMAIKESPILFSGSNATAVYNDYTWFNPCYERALTYAATYVAYWFIGDDAYCSVHVSLSSGNLATDPPFAQKYLARAEAMQTRCED